MGRAGPAVPQRQGIGDDVSSRDSRDVAEDVVERAVGGDAELIGAGAVERGRRGIVVQTIPVRPLKSVHWFGLVSRAFERREVGGRTRFA